MPNDEITNHPVFAALSPQARAQVEANATVRHDGHSPMPEHGDPYRDRMVCECCGIEMEYAGDGYGGDYAAVDGTTCPDGPAVVIRPDNSPEAVAARRAMFTGFGWPVG